MKKNSISLAVASASLLVTTASLAVSFNSFDPKSMAMGGAGVAVANPGSAPFFNPALISIADIDDDFALELPVMGARVFDPDDFVDSVDDFDDTVMDNLDEAITNYDSARAGGNISDILTSINGVSTGINTLNEEVLTLSDKPFQFEGGGGIVLAVPGEKFGMAFSASGSASFSGVLEYEDADTVTNLTNDMDDLSTCYALADPLVDPVTFTSCISNAGLSDFIDISDPTNPVIEFTAQSDTGGDSDIQSKVRVVGVVLAEAGLTFSREMAMFGTEVAVGVTPKMVSVTVFDYEANADSAESDDIDGEDYSVDYDDFNLDVGVAMNYKNGWRSGFVIKNLIAQDYDAMNTDPVSGVETATGRTISLKPQARVGISHTNDWSTASLDIDLTENEGLGLAGNNSQYVALGIELNALDWAQIRLGYRADTANSDRDVMSAGFGVSPFGVHIDLAVAGNADEVGASFQLGFRF
ncbi:MAG: conjugal transfer protein TraF [Gammaproteobacteria bacterium]|nr:conjugal transfer protein TraF [Gammaproteobacteria bacterium]